MLTRIRTDQIEDRQVTRADLADGVIDASKLDLPGPGQDGDLLTTDGAGNLAFVTPTIAGLADVDLTSSPPQNGDVLAFDGGSQSWVPFSANLSPTGFSRTFVVNTILDRDALSPNEGDQAFVRTGTDGEWEVYLWDGAAWFKITTRDSARTDSNTVEALVTPISGPASLLGNVSQGSRATLVTVEVTVAFDGAPSLTVGDAGDNERLIGDGFHDLSEVGTYNVQTDYVFSDALDTDIFVYFGAGGSTVGSARVLVTYV